jgi:hypothetical protein
MQGYRDEWDYLTWFFAYLSLDKAKQLDGRISKI